MANSLKNKFKWTALAALIVTLLSCTVIAFTGLGGARTANAETGVSAQSNETLAAAWNSAVQTSSSTNQVTVTLTEDWTADSSHYFGMGAGFSSGRIYVPAGANIQLDLNGYTINRGLTSATANGSVIYVEGNLEITDSSASKNGKITGGKNTSNGGGICVDGGNLTINGGNITGNKADHAVGGGVYVEGGTLSMNGGEISDNEGYAYCGGVYLKNSSFTMNDGKIANNVKRGVYMSDGSTFTMNGGIISGNTSYNEEGGGISVHGTFIMTGGTISDNTSTSNGGGVYVDSDGTFTMDGGTVLKNEANYYGGGVYVDRDGTFNLSDGTIAGNKAPNGGGGGVYVPNGTFKMEGGEISGNTAANGGGVYVGGGIFSMSNGTIVGNKATESAGGIYMYSGTYTISGGTISGNTATSNGGGIYKTGSGGVCTMTGGEISGNTATNGGGIWFTAYNGSTFNFEGGVVTGNTATLGGGVYSPEGGFNMTGGEINGNKATTFGDNICYEKGWVSAVELSLANSGIQVGVYLSSDMTASSGSFGTGTGYYNGALHVPAGANILLNLNGYTINRGLTSATENGSVFCVEGNLEITDTSSAKTGTITGGGASPKGGGVLVNGGSLTLTSGAITGNMVLNNCGGGVYVENGMFTMNGGEVSSNVADHAMGAGVGVGTNGTFIMNGGTISKNNSYANGSGVTVNGGTFIMNGGTISDNNEDNSYGNIGVYLSDNGTFEMNDGAITGHTAAGGVYVGNGTFTMNGGEISGNNTTSDGGGVYSSGTFTMYGGTISGNTASGLGGGVYSSGTFNMTNGVIIGNTANGGGGVQVSGGTFTMSGGTISDNTETASGAGGGGVRTSAEFIMTGGTISGNTASTAGGGVYLRAGTFTMSGGTISGNNAAGNGGGVYSVTTFTMAGGEITSNTAGNHGGGVYNGGTFTMAGGTIIANTSQNGGGVYDGGKFTVNSGTISGNTSTQNGGGVYITASCVFEMNGGAISDNTATNNAGGVFVDGVFTMNSGKISGNKTVNFSGGGVYSNSTFTMNGGEITGNTAHNNGSGVYNAGTFTMAGGIISGNSILSGYGAGVYYYNGTFNLSGGTVTGNSKNGLANNVYLSSGKVINITGNLLNGGTAARVGISMQTAGTFTSGYNTANSSYAPSMFFISDESYAITLSSGEAVLGTTTVTLTTVTWQYSSDGSHWSNLESTNNTIYYTGATYTVRVMNGSTVLNGNVTPTSASNGNTVISGAGKYAFVYNGSNIANPVMNLEILSVEITWQYSLDGGSTWVNFDGDASPYNGLAWQVRAYDAVNNKAVTLTTAPSGEIKDAATYAFAVDGTNYGNATFNLTITKLTLEIVWDFTGATQEGSNYFWIYDGLAHAPVAVITGAPNEQIGNIDLSYVFDLKGASSTFAKADAGEYLLTVSLKEADPNVIINNATVNYSIKPKTLTLTFTGVKGNKITAKYDGEGHGVEAVLSGLLPKDYAQEVIVSYYLDNSLISGLPTNVGTYSAKATLPANCYNYVLDRAYECTIIIETKTVTVSWTGNADKNGDFVWTFDGLGKAPAASITDPVSGNGMTINATYAPITGGVRGTFTSTKPVNAGKYVMRVELSVSSDKYVLEDTEREFEIEKLGVTLTWKYDGKLENGVVRWAYDGQPHTVTPEIKGVQVTKDGVFGVDLTVTRTGSAALTGVGKGSASAALDASDSFNANFYIINTDETTLSYEVYKRVITSATWTDKDGNTFNLGSGAAYDFGEVSGAKGPNFSAVAAGANGNLNLTVTYSDSYEGDWPVDANGYIAYAKLTASDFANYCFADGGDTMSITFVIRSISGSKENIDVTWVIFTDAENYITLADFIAANGGDKFFFTFNGTAQAPSALYIKDNGEFEELAISNNSKGTNAGNYTARLLPSDTYVVPAEQATCDFEIKPLDITIDWQNAVDDSQTTFVYNYDGNAHAPYPTVSGNGNVPCPVNVGSETNAGVYTATASVGGNFNVVSGATQEFTINQKELNVTLVNWSATGAEERKDNEGNVYYVWVYDGNAHAPTATVTDAQLGITLNLSVLGATSDVGTNYAIAMLDGSNEMHANYKLNGTAMQRFEIVRVPAGTVIWEDGAGHTSIDGDTVLILTYNGTVQAPTAYFMNDGTKVILNVLGAMKDVGTYKAWVTGDFDFGGKTPECEFTIVAKELNVVWSDTTVTFGGSALSPVATVEDSELGYTLVKGTDYTVDEFVNAGSYTAEIRFTNKNYTYQGATNKTAFTINKIDLSGDAVWSFDGADVVDGVYTVQYNAATQAPVVTVDGFTLDGAAVTFTFGYTGAVATVGGHTVTATVATAEWNGKDIAANFTLGTANGKDYNIIPFEVTVVWNFDGADGAEDGVNFWYYTGDEHAPEAYFTDWSGAQQQLTVYGAAINARAAAYTASVTAPENCVIKDAASAETTFIIKQATIEVEWSAEGDYTFVDGVYIWVYDGNAHAPKAVIKGTDNALPVLGEETDAGEYIATAAQSDGNYVISAGATQSFKIEALTVYVKWYGADGSDENFKWAYTGKEQGPTAKLADNNGDLIKDKNGNDIEVKVAGASATVGTHTASATNTFVNYVFAADAKLEQTFEIIAKALEGFAWLEGGATVTVVDGKTVYTYIYNGDNLQPVPTSAFGDDLQFNVTIIDTKTNKEVRAITEAGTYTVTAVSLNPNFAVPADKATLNVVVSPYEAEVVWSEEPLVYNGAGQQPAAHYLDARGNEVDLTVTVTETEHKAAGKYHATASFTAASPNYVLKGATTEFEIEKVKLTVEWQWTGWTDKALTYDGEEHAPVPEIKSAAALNITITYTVYDKDNNPVADNKVIDAGEYTIKLSLSGDGAENYAFDSDKETFKINKKALSVTADDLTVDYGADAPDYTATFSNDYIAGDKDLIDAALAKKGQWLRCEYVSRYAPGTYDIGIVQSVIDGLLKNYDITATAGTLTVKVVPFTVVWYKDGSNQRDYNADYSGKEYKPSAYYVDHVNGDMILLDVVYATYNDITGEYTAVSGASPAIDAGTYYVMVVTPEGITLTNAGTSYEIYKLNITVNISSVDGVFGDVYDSDGELIHAQLTYKFGDVNPVDDLGIKLTLSCASSDFDNYGFLNVGNYNIVGSWNSDDFAKNYNLTFVGEAEEEGGHNSNGTYTLAEAEISVTKDKETWSGEDFEEILASSNGVRQYISLDAQETDEGGERQYTFIDYAGHKSADMVNVSFSTLHDLSDHAAPKPEEDNFYPSSPYMDAAGRYAVNYKIEIANHVTLYGTWNVLIVPADGIVTIEFVKDYEVTYGEAVPENIAALLLDGGYIKVYGYSTNAFARSAVVTVSDGLGGTVDNTTGVGRYDVNIEIKDDDPNEIHYVRYTDDSNIGRYVITPKLITVDWGTTTFTQDKDNPDKVWAADLGITVSGFVTADALTLDNINVGADGAATKTEYEVTDNGVTVKLVLTATGDFKSAGGNTLVLSVESGNYTLAVENSAAAVTINSFESPAAPAQGGAPSWLWWIIGVIAFVVLVLIIVIAALAKRKKDVSGDDDGFYEDAAESD